MDKIHTKTQGSNTIIVFQNVVWQFAHANTHRQRRN